MKFIRLISLISVLFGKTEKLPSKGLVGYLTEVAVPLAERIREAEDAMDFRIVGGSGATLGQFPYQAGLLVKIGLKTAACGGALVSNKIVLTAAHCWNDGRDIGSSMTVILGSVQLFMGGERMETNIVVTHPKWDPVNIVNDVAVINLPKEVKFSHDISPINLPSGSELKEDFNGVKAVASGFGQTGSSVSIGTNQFLSYIDVVVISNKECIKEFPAYVKESSICTSGQHGKSTCHGDSGGPLALTRNGRTILIGITSFGGSYGCGTSRPVVFARTTLYMDFINKYLK